MKKCPFCSEEIQDEAIKCRYCHERLDTQNQTDITRKNIIEDEVRTVEGNKSICPKCGYERTKQDDLHTPKTECPSCGVIYAKVKTRLFKQTAIKQKQKEENVLEDQKTEYSSCGVIYAKAKAILLKPIIIKSKSSPPVKKRLLLKVLTWIIGLVFLFSGFSSVTTPMIAIVFFILAGLLLPPIRKFVGNKTGITIPAPIRVVTVLVLIGIGGTFIERYELQESMQKSGFATVEEYKKAQTEKILAELESTSEYSYEKKKGLYQELKKLNPENRDYHVKFDAFANPKKPKLTENEESKLRDMIDKENYLNVFGSEKSMYSPSDIRSIRRDVWSKVLKRLLSRPEPNENEIQYCKIRLSEL